MAVAFNLAPPKWQFFGPGGVPADGYRLYAYAAGTLDHQPIFSESDGITAHPQPATLDSLGQIQVFGVPGTGYKFILKNAADAEVWAVDNCGFPDTAVAAVGAEPVGTIKMWATAAPPAGYLLLNNQAVSRATYSDLFALWGTTFGVGDGVTTFNVIDMRGYFPLGVTAAGTGSVLGGVGGNIIDYIHAHAQTVHRHGVGTYDIQNAGAHTHGAGSLVTGTPSQSDDFTAGASAAASETHTHDVEGDTGSAGDHDHAFTGESADSAAVNTGNSAVYTPPFRALHFIVKALETADGAVIGAAQAYAPVWSTAGTAPAIGDGTIVGRYTKIGQRVDFTITLTAGSTTTFGTGAWIFTLPVTAEALATGGRPAAAVVAQTAAGTPHAGAGRLSDTTTVRPAVGSSFVTNTTPFAWAVGDFLTISGSYTSA